MSIELITAVSLRIGGVRVVFAFTVFCRMYLFKCLGEEVLLSFSNDERWWPVQMD